MSQQKFWSRVSRWFKSPTQASTAEESVVDVYEQSVVDPVEADPEVDRMMVERALNMERALKLERAENKVAHKRLVPLLRQFAFPFLLPSEFEEIESSARDYPLGHRLIARRHPGGVTPGTVGNRIRE